ncbi:formate dehydrogenase accessory sulfurtransferase FdhD [Paucibacter sp. TC2R-5]|uniref:formate dehydrogenase accessory sulfurtransferase FdhD n=1 Tax=Paucibacter sp. TC2R-5 TaxID=2893555 RepID=UPI0021E3C4BC|nr:formate dehydrogenase accessory sulfurtransferase FdhD [Paucibacter sp. TC2R-5]MCV2357764.1 formate dehydrogenase accessory sulfurtransferase FdhD [Paucibacter sp. TC2R-5]
MRSLPRLTQCSAPLTREVSVLDEFGLRRSLHIPAERPLTVFVDKRELVTLMTLGQAPELLVLGYLRNQRLVSDVGEVESITVDWEVGAAAVRTRAGIAQIEEKTAQRIVTTGCGQGTVFGALMADVNSVQLPSAASARLRQSSLYAMLEQARKLDSVYKKAGSVHGCALFCGEQMLVHMEDVGRHNAIDSIAGWMWMQSEMSGESPVSGADKCFYTTGRLTSEMVMKSAQMGVPIIVSRNGITQMGHALGLQLGLTLIGRAKGRHFICYSGFDRFDSEPEPARLLSEAS